MGSDNKTDEDGIDQRPFRLGGLFVEPARNLIKGGEQEFSIEPMIMDVLCVLASQSKDVVTRNRLIKDIWGVQYGSDESLTRAISLLRKTFRSAGEPDGYIETIPKSGYRLRQQPLYSQAAAITESHTPADVQPSPLIEAPIEHPAADKMVVAIEPAAPVPNLASQSGAEKISKKTTLKLFAGFMVLAIGAAAAAAFLPERPLNVTINSAPGQTRSVGVLSFADMSAKQDQEYFTDGIAEEILHSLAKIPDIRVAGRTSSFSFKGKSVDMREIGRSLNVSHLVDGSVRKQGDNLRITVQLINTDDGLSMWSKSYDGTLQDFLALQKQVSSDIVSELKVVLSVGIEQIILLDDVDFGPLNTAPSASAELVTPPLLYPIILSKSLNTGRLGVSLAEQARQDQPSGKVQMVSADQALAADLKAARLHTRRGEWSNAIDKLEQVRANDPLSPEALSHVTFLHYLKGDAVAARQSAGRNLRWNPNNSIAFLEIAELMKSEGDISGAHQALLDALRVSPDMPSVNLELAVFYARLGLKREALEFLEPSALKLMPLILLGDRDKAVQLITRENMSEGLDLGHYILGDIDASYAAMKTYALTTPFAENPVNVDTAEISAILVDVFRRNDDLKADNILKNLRAYFANKHPKQMSNLRNLKAGAMLSLLDKDEMTALTWIDAAIARGLSDVNFLNLPLFEAYRETPLWQRRAGQIDENAQNHYRLIRDQRSAFIGSDFR